MSYKNIEDKRKNQRQYYSNHKEESAERCKQYYYNNKGKEGKRHRQRYICKGREEYFILKYGLTKKDWEGLWYAQDGRCAICDKFFEKIKDAYVDHNHKTDKARSLLCNKCNLGIGFFNDNPELLKNAREYLIE